MAISHRPLQHIALLGVVAIGLTLLFTWEATKQVAIKTKTNVRLSHVHTLTQIQDKQSDPLDALCRRGSPLHAIRPISPRRDPSDDYTFEDDAEDTRINSLLKELGPNVDSQLSYLIYHLDDDRYCFSSMDSDERVFRWTVGDVCHDVLSETISYAYYRHIEDGRFNGDRVASALHQLPLTRSLKSFKAWLDARKDVPLYQLQIEACDEAKAECDQAAERSRNFRGFDGRSNEQRQLWTKSYEDLKTTFELERESLKNSKKPALVNRWLSDLLFPSPPSRDQTRTIIYNENKLTPLWKPLDRPIAPDTGLIRSLCSKNVPPIVESPFIYKHPVMSRDELEEEERIRAILHNLGTNVESDFALLRQHIDDRRYCATLESRGEIYHYWTIGDVCHELIADTISYAWTRPFENSGTRYFYPIGHFRLKWKLKKWLDDRSDKKLYELQMDGCDEVLANLKSDRDYLQAEIKKGEEVEHCEKLLVGLDSRANIIRQAKQSLIESKTPVLLKKWPSGDVYN